MLNPTLHQYHRQLTTAIKHRKYITELEIWVKNNKIYIFANGTLYIILIGHFPKIPGKNSICAIEGFLQWDGKGYMNVQSSLVVIMKILFKIDRVRHKGFVFITQMAVPN